MNLKAYFPLFLFISSIAIFQSCGKEAETPKSASKGAIESQPDTPLSIVVPESGLTCLAFSLDGKMLVGGGMDNTIRMWDTQSGKLLRTLEGHKSSIMSLAFSPDGKKMVSGEMAYGIKVWDLEKFEIQFAYEQPRSPSALAFLGDSNHFVSVCGAEVFLWGSDPVKPRLIWAGRDMISSLAVTSADEVVVGTQRGALVVLEAQTGAIIAQHKREKSPTAAGGLMDNVVGGLFPCPDGHILIGDRTGTWDWDRKTDTIRLVGRSLSRVKAVSPKGDFYFGVSVKDPYFFVRDREQVGTLAIVTPGWKTPVLAVSPNGQYLAVHGGGNYDAEGRWTHEGEQRILIYQWKDLEAFWELRKTEAVVIDSAGRTDYSQVLPNDPPEISWE